MQGGQGSPVEVILAILFFGLILYLIDQNTGHHRRRPAPPTRRSNTSGRAATRGTGARPQGLQTTSRPSVAVGQPRPHPSANVYRPISSTAKPQPNKAIVFVDTTLQPAAATERSIADLVDPLTGARLQPSAGLYRCKCGVYYQANSFEVIRAENGSRCVSCRQVGNIVRVSPGQETKGRNASVSSITLDNYRQYEGQVITFEGDVVTVREASTGKDYAVMFEDRSWVRGFKMVFFRGTVQQIGGPQFLFSLVGRTVRVRGLLVNHSTFGYEIIVNDPAMILGVS